MKYYIKTIVDAIETSIRIEYFENLGILDFSNYPDTVKVFMDGREGKNHNPSFSTFNNPKIIKMYKNPELFVDRCDLSVSENAHKIILENERLCIRFSLEEILNHIINKRIKFYKNCNKDKNNEIIKLKEEIEKNELEIQKFQQKIENEEPCNCVDIYEEPCDFDSYKECHEDAIERIEKDTKTKYESIEVLVKDLAEIENKLDKLNKIKETPCTRDLPNIINS